MTRATPIPRGQEPLPIVEPVGQEGFQALVQFMDYDKGLPLDARVVASDTAAGFLRQKIVFRGMHGDPVPGYLALPAGSSGPCPVVLELHGAGGSKEGWWDDEGGMRGGLVTRGLLSRGIAVLALDARSHGERAPADPEDSVASIMAGRRWVAYRDIMLDTVVDYRIAMDYLATRSDVDASRIGAVGYSLGGQLSFMLAAADRRLKTVVACVVPPSCYSINKAIVVDPDMTPEEYRDWAASPANRALASTVQPYVRGIGSRLVLMLMGRKDEVCSVDEARQLYELVPSPAKEIELYDSGHGLPPEYAERASRWLEEQMMHRKGQPTGRD